MPALTEAWAATYLQVLAGLLAFALGLRALILQLVVPSYVQSVASRRADMRWVGALAFFVVGSSAGLVWVMHPTGHESLTGVKAFAAASLVTANLVLVPVVLWRSASWWSFESVLEKIRESIVVTYYEKRTVDEELIAEVVFLGKETSVTQESKRAIGALFSIAETVQRGVPGCRRCLYKGDQLVELVKGISTVSQASVSSGNMVTEIGQRLEELRQRALAFGGPASCDAAQAGLALGDLVESAISSGRDAAAVRLLEIIRVDPRALFRAGIAAIEDGKFTVGVAALNKLECIVESQGGSHNFGLPFLIGLLGVMHSASPSGARRARVFLERNYSSSQLMRNVCSDAARVHWRAGRYQVADAINRLEEGL